MSSLRAATDGPADGAGGTAGKVGGRAGEADETVDDLCFTARALAQTHPMTEAAHRYRQCCHETERSRQPAPEPADWASTALLVGYCLRRAEEQRTGTAPESAGSEGERLGPEVTEAGPEPIRTEDALAGVEPVGTGAALAGVEPVGAGAALAGVEPVGAGAALAGVEPVGAEAALAGVEPDGTRAGSDDLSGAIAAVAESLRAGEAERVTRLDPAVVVSALDRVIATELDKRQEHLREQLDDQEWAELEDYIAWWTVHGYALRAVEFP